MKHHLPVYLKTRLGFVLFLIIGYGLAILFSRQELCADLNSGSIRSYAVIFPFRMEITDSSPNPQFERLFLDGKLPSNHCKNLALISRSYAFVNFDIGLECVIFEGSSVVRHEGKLHGLFTSGKITKEEAQGYVDNYLKILKESGLREAGDYIGKLEEKILLPPPGELP
jgi:hypothetical protein